MSQTEPADATPEDRPGPGGPGPARTPSPPAGAGYRIGAEVVGTDGVLGHLIWLALDPLGPSLTHLAVEPVHRAGLARLVPVSLVRDAGPRVRVELDRVTFERLEEAEETWFLPYGPSVDAGFVGPASAMAWPYFGIAGSATGTGGVASPIISDKVPVGEAEVRRGDRVQASDGEIGRVQGLVVDPADQHVTHVLLQEGHLWGRKQVAIPIGSVRPRVGDAIGVARTTAEIRDLPPVELASGKGYPGTG